MKLLGSIKSKITEDENVKHFPHLYIAEVILAHCNIVNNNYSHHLLLINHFVNN